MEQVGCYDYSGCVFPSVCCSIHDTDAFRAAVANDNKTTGNQVQVGLWRKYGRSCPAKISVQVQKGSWCCEDGRREGGGAAAAL